ncbi:FHA domain-containing protein [Saccharophagus sp. K07]|uniref:FHA domain-containing protein n=1 Tax=Saccharophagus sp. K07 TaxID=2283636 RepID=UPI001651E653|nr:FHA domain-containing protein [Saccharophagus sp. K07]MBC6905966.1 FHA domain-containing protein [Saccharophagus sp. K07]
MFLHIVVSINNSELHRYNFTETEILIGRSSECDVLLDNAGISRTHAKILRQGNEVKLIDLNSGNGTFLNGQSIQEATVTSDDTIGIGKFALTVKLSEEALPDSEPPPSAEPPPVTTSTVFLRPDETRKILQQTQTPKAQATTQPTRPSQAESGNSNSLWIFAAGAVVGLLFGWLFWG